MHDFLLKRTVHERIFKRLDKIITSLLKDESASSRLIERRMKEFTERWIALQEAHDFYIISCFSNAQDIEEQDRYIEMLSTKFYTTESECEKHLIEVEANRRNQTADDEANRRNKTAENAFKIERFKFPTFDGHVRKYAKFKYEFQKFVNPLCTPNQLPFALKTYLCDSVRRDVENCDHNIDLMWRRLDDKYGKRQKLVDCIISDIKRLPECNNTQEQLLEMINTVEAANNDLNCIDANEELNNSTIISMIEQRMNRPMHDEWVKLIIHKPHSERFEALLSFLENWKTHIEYKIADVRLPAQEAPVRKNPVRTCLIHRNCEHPVWRCRTFQSLSVPERLNIVRSSHACILCLETGHNELDCKKVAKCSRNDCNQKHNILLHGGDL